MHVADVVEAFVRCSSDATSGRRYNVGTGTATSVRALHDVLAEVCGSDARPRTASPRAGELHTISLDSAALSRDTGWRPRVPLREGLEETVAWVRARRDTPARGPSRA